MSVRCGGEPRRGPRVPPLQACGEARAVRAAGRASARSRRPSKRRRASTHRRTRVVVAGPARAQVRACTYVVQPSVEPTEDAAFCLLAAVADLLLVAIRAQPVSRKLWQQ